MIDERLESQYVVTFEEYGNTQQCSVDFLRPLPGAECSACGGPKEVVDGCCYFCGEPSEEPAAADKEHASKQKPKVAKAPHAEEVASTAAKSSVDGSELDHLRSEVARLNQENEELRARLHEAMEANQRKDAELEALKNANKVNRLRQSHSKLKEAAAETSKPLPRPPPRGTLVRESSATQVGAGRGRTK